MRAFYFDVGGVIIEDKLAPCTALQTFSELCRHWKQVDPLEAYSTYLALQPSLDIGTTSLAELCSSLGVSQDSFEHSWLAIHPPNSHTIRVMDQLLDDGHQLGLATNICRRLLDLLISTIPQLSRVKICCSADIGAAKPSKVFFDRATDIIGSQDIIFVDDRVENLIAAQAMGWTCVHAVNDWTQRFSAAYLEGRGQYSCH